MFTSFRKYHLKEKGTSEHGHINEPEPDKRDTSKLNNFNLGDFYLPESSHNRNQHYKSFQLIRDTTIF